MSNGIEKSYWIRDHGLVLAVCDKELLGKTIEGVTISEKFYKGELVGEEKLKEKLKNAKNINLFGKNCIDVAIELKMAQKDSCLIIGEVPHLNLVCI